MALQGVLMGPQVCKNFLFIDPRQLPSKGILFNKGLNALFKLMRKNVAFSIEGHSSIYFLYKFRVHGQSLVFVISRQTDADVWRNGKSDFSSRVPKSAPKARHHLPS